MFIRRKKLEELKKSSQNLLEHVEKLQNQTVLIGIERRGRVNIFTFSRGDQIHQIETMGLLGDDVKQWKKDLLQGREA